MKRNYVDKLVDQWEVDQADDGLGTDDADFDNDEANDPDDPDGFDD